MAIEPDRRFWLNLPTFRPTTPEDHQANLVELERWANTLPLNPRTSVALYGDTTGEKPPWNLPWGVVAYTRLTADHSGISTITFLNDLAVNFTGIANRQYHASAAFEITQTTASDVWVVKLLQTEDSPDTQLKRATSSNGTTSSITHHLHYLTSASTAGAHTWALSLERASGGGTMTLSANTNNPAYLLVEDIGPLTATPPSA